VLLAGPTALPAVTTEELLRLQPQTVVVVGGPGAVSAEVEGQLAQLLPGATVTRRGGADRYGTAAAISGDLTSAEVVHVATGADFPDALAGAARAGTVGSPVLLVQPGAVPSVTRAEIERLAPERIVVLGGPVAVSEAVADELGAYGVVERIAGPDRYGTAAQVAADLPASPEVLVATGQDWPDALAGAARAGAAGSPVLLVSTTGVPSATSGSLDRLDPDRIVVLGGPVAVDEVVVELLRTPR
jgi:putative cell wall-binding protein